MMPSSTAKGSLSISDIMAEVGCKRDRAAAIMLQELPHTDISAAGSRKPSWRCKRRDFERWLTAREQPPRNDRLEAFAQKYLRGARSI